MKLKVTETLLRVWPQWATCLTVTLLSISVGLKIGWTSPYLAQLTKEDSPLRITDDEATWIVSLLPFGRLFGAVVGYLAMEYYGSKRSLLISGIPIMISWICIILADSAVWLYVSRLCAGMCFGMFYGCFAMYMGEVAAPEIRGALVSTIINGLPFGTLIGSIMGSQVSMMCFGVVSLVLAICFMIIFPLLPQSPHHYVRNDNSIEARKTIQWYHRKSNVNAELELIENFVRSSRSMNFRHKLKQITERKNRRSLILIILLYIFMQLSGVNTVTYYMEIIVRKAKVTILEPATIVIIVNGIGIAVGWISVYLIDRYGRRVLMAVSCGCVIIGMVLLGLHFMLLEQNFDSKNLEWLPILAMIFYVMISIGLIPVPSTVLGEFFSDDLKSIAGFAVSITSALFAFVSSATYQPMIDLTSEKYVYWMYAMVMIVCMIYSFVEIPETKGKTLQEIQEMLQERQKKGRKIRKRCKHYVCHTLCLFRTLTMTMAIDGKLSKRILWPQWIAGFGVLLLGTEVGLMGGWSSPYISELTSPNSSFTITISELSWVVSLFNLGRLIGCIKGALCSGYFGSEKTILISSMPITLSWLFIILANRVEWIYVARFLGGLSLGMVYSCYSLYLGEIANPTIRGALVAMGTTGLPIGNLLMSVMGAYLSMHTSALIALISCIVMIIIFVWLPESPYHLIKKKLDEKAKYSIQWYHRECDVEHEFKEMRKFVENLDRQSLSDTLKELKILHYRKSIIIVSVLIVYSQLSGINSILFYMEPILTTAKVSVMEPAQVVIIVMAGGVVASCLSIFVLDRFGRKFLMIMSCSAILLSYGILTVEFHLLDLGFDSKKVEGLAIIGMILFYISVFLGIILVPSTMMGEIFPQHLKCIAACIVSISGSTIAFLSTFTYLTLLDFMTEKYLFLFYGLLVASCIPFTVCFVPETKGLSLQEIQNKLTGKDKKTLRASACVDKDKFSQEQNLGPYVISRDN
ncbi:facilitated trehalose transporter Tret1-like [Apis florea]|uniref:facilitated trehalose transporter Tret1-like n=1 Tax=Apis florea TaxID=7463 RepID=UPI0012FE9B0C|nr:facilitated trehalose transporter Tret1-like [Apis florea]